MWTYFVSTHFSENQTFRPLLNSGKPESGPKQARSCQSRANFKRRIRATPADP